VIDHVKKTKVSIKEEITKRCKGKKHIGRKPYKKANNIVSAPKRRYITSQLSISTNGAKRQHH